MIHNYSHRQSRGFTLIELMIAMAFISLLLLAIAAAVMQVGAIYNKGITMKSVDQAGRVVTADMKRTIDGSQPFDVATAFRPHIYGNGDGGANYDGGRLCTGIYSYIWNIGTYVDPGRPETQANRYGGADSDKQLRLVKVRDSGGQYCKNSADQPIDSQGATELLSSGNLAVQQFRIERTTDNMATGMALYSISITISDADSAAIDTVDNSCKPPSQDETYQNYCAVNEFAFTARAGNKGGQ